MVSNQKRWNWFANRLTPSAVVAVTALVLLLYDRWFLYLEFLNPVFWSLSNLLVSYLACLSFVIAAFVWSKPRILAKAWLTVGMVFTLAFPFLSPLLYGEYQLYAEAASGYEMQWVTQPGNRISSALKAVQQRHDSNWCNYTLYGWGADNALYYGASCQVGYWRYDPGTEEARWVVSIREDAKSNSVVKRENVSVGQGLVAENLREFEPFTAYPVIVDYSSVSADGEWRAAAIREYYGPHDVVILRAKR